MRSVKVAELKDKLSKYLRFAKEGEESVLRWNRRLCKPAASTGFDIIARSRSDLHNKALTKRILRAKADGSSKV